MKQRNSDSKSELLQWNILLSIFILWLASQFTKSISRHLTEVNGLFEILLLYNRAEAKNKNVIYNASNDHKSNYIVNYYILKMFSSYLI